MNLRCLSWSWLMLLAHLGGCQTMPTQVVVEIGVEDELRVRADALRVRVWDHEGALVRDQSTAPRSREEVPLLAKNSDGTRRFRVLAELVADTGCVFARQLVIAGYSQDEQRVVRVEFEASCADQSCPQDETCIGGICEPACYVPQPSTTSGISVPTSCAAAMDAGVRTPGPTIDGLDVDVSSNSVSITWDLEPPGTGQVELGDSATYGSFTMREDRLLPQHIQPINGLSGGTAYHFRLLSSDGDGNETVSPEYCFVTP